MAAGQSALDFAVEYGVPLLRETLLGMDPLDFEDMSFGSLRGSLLGVTVTDVQLSQVTTTLLPGERVKLDINGITLEARALAVQAKQPFPWPIPDITCTGVSRSAVPSRPAGGYAGWLSLPWSANQDSPFPSTWWSGTIRSSSANNRISLEMGVGLNPYTGAPTISGITTTCNIPSSSLSVTTNGMWCDFAIQFFSGFFSGYSADLCNMAREAVEDFMLEQGNEILSKLDIAAVPMGGGSPYLSLGMHAAVINTQSSQPEMPRPHPPSRDLSPDGRMLTAGVSGWTIETLLYIVHRAGMMNATLTKELLPDNPLLQLVSDGLPWLTVAPALYAMNPSTDMAVEIRSSGPSSGEEGIADIAIDGGTITMTANMDLIFRAVEGSGPPLPPPPPPALYLCDQVSGQCVLDEGGIGLPECEADCEAPAPPSPPPALFRCIFDTCSIDSTGEPLEVCEATCGVPPPPPPPSLYRCLFETCSIDSAGVTLEECQASCGPTMYRCMFDRCGISADGAPLAECEATCPQRYRCIFGQCGMDVTGVPLAQCQSTCSSTDAPDEDVIMPTTTGTGTSTGSGRRQAKTLLLGPSADPVLGTSAVTGQSVAKLTGKEGEELFALSCPLVMKLALDVEPATTEDGLPTTRVLVEFLEGSCDVALLRSNVGDINLGPIFGFQGVIDNILIPAMIAVVNEVAADGFLFPAVMGFSATNAQLIMLENVAEFGLDLAYSPPPPPMLGASMRVSGGGTSVNGVYVKTMDGCVSLARPVYRRVESPARWLYLAGSGTTTFRWYINSNEARVCRSASSIARSAEGACNGGPGACPNTWQELVGSTWTTRPAFTVSSIPVQVATNTTSTAADSEKSAPVSLPEQELQLQPADRGQYSL